jgi:transaldolase
VGIRRQSQGGEGLVGQRSAGRRAVFLDRDGVLNATRLRDGRPRPPATAKELHILPGVAQALHQLRRAGFLLIVVTNQPDVGAGLIPRAVVESMHARLRRSLPIDDVRVCWNRADPCYKPRPDMLLAAAADWGIGLEQSFMVGDRWRDIVAGKSAGCYTILVGNGYGEPLPMQPNARFDDLGSCVPHILNAGLQPRESHMLDQLKIKIFCDGASLPKMLALAQHPWIRGFTTNPTLMRKAGVSDYRAFAREVLLAIVDRPVSFEVFADDLAGMEAQAREIASWGRNVNVKVPVTNTQGVSTAPLVARLAGDGIVINVTAVFTLDQVREVAECLDARTPAIVSVFAGRIADTGADPVPLMRAARNILAAKPKAELLWASPRELLNVIQAEETGCHIVTATDDLLSKVNLLGKDHGAFSLETVQMFYRDARAAGFCIETAPAAAVGTGIAQPSPA